ncbi:prolyl 4-hydroxylase, alpha subunit [Luminiphilus syltensis NOR5-1B]|uniref:Prolyl 4-hydroxylase, alpha subunit n=2 Tax=Luminiphilus TaxID=1341118 RepID=B8KYM1_9GAMM|nr:prolyl 4-hydroxylase, alpha subunit [Luminiphilus syltensis NOR5-1B]
MVVFPSETFHELLRIRCPSGRFEDSRFAVTNWIWRNDPEHPPEAQGWGHMNCARIHLDWNAS